MDWLLDVVTGPWGSLWVSLFVAIGGLLLEYLVIKPIFEKPATGNQPIIKQKGKKNKIQIDQSRTLVIKQYVRPERSEQHPRSDASSNSDDTTTWLGLGGALIGVGLLAWAGLKYQDVLVNVMIGVAVGTLINAVVLYLRYRTSVVPFARWTLLSLVVSATVIYSTNWIRNGHFRGVNSSDASSLLRDLGFQDGISAMLSRYPKEVILYFGFQILGVLLLIFIVFLIDSRLLGLGIAAAALESPNPRPLALRLLRLLYPSEKTGLEVFLLACGAGFAVLIISGIYFGFFTDLPKWTPIQTPTSTP